MHRIGGTGRNQSYVNNGARGPGVAFVDRIAVCVYLQGAIKMRTLFDRAPAVVLDHAAPENRLALVIDSFEFEPGIVGIDGTSGEEVANALGANHDIDADGVAAADGGLHPVERRRDRGGFGSGAGRDFGLCFFAYCESGCEFVLRDCSWL